MSQKIRIWTKQSPKQDSHLDFQYLCIDVKQTEKGQFNCSVFPVGDFRHCQQQGDYAQFCLS